MSHLITGQGFLGVRHTPGVFRFPVNPTEAMFKRITEPRFDQTNIFWLRQTFGMPHPQISRPRLGSTKQMSRPATRQNLGPPALNEL